MNQNLTEKEIVEVKGIIKILISNMKQVLRLDPVAEKIRETIHDAYNEGLSRVDRAFEPSVNVHLPNNAIRQLEMLNNYVFQNIQDVGDDIGNALRQELQRGLLNGDTKKELIKRVRFVFKENKFKNRFKTIIRTETLRANNTAALEAAKQIQSTSKIEMRKWIDVIMDDRTTDTCKREHKLYPKKRAIPLDQDFEFIWQNKKYKAQNPPFHPNCRSVVRFVRVNR